jgi:mono/diheme cytochrome c family protein
MTSRLLAPVALCLLAFVSAAQAEPAGSLERGKYLVQGMVACGNCHFQRGPQGEPLTDKGLSGGMLFDDPPFKAYAANITPDPATGIGKWTDAQLARAIREGVRPDKRVIGPPMPIEFYRSMSDEDVASIIAYLRAQPAVVNQVPKSRYDMPLPASYGPALKAVQAPSRDDPVKYGKYLADMAHCMECHTPRNAKGMLQMGLVGTGGNVFKGPWGQSVSRNLTPHETGLKGWTDAQISKAVREGVSRDGKPYKPPMGFAFYRNISDADMAALIAYLRSLKPLPMGGAKS